MSHAYDLNAPKRPVNMTLNQDLVRRARALTGNLSERVEQLLAEYLLAEHKRCAERDARLDAAIEALNAFDETHGSFADEHSSL